MAKKANAAFMKPLTPSDKLAEIVGAKPLPRTEVVKKLWAYIKKNNLQDKKNKRNINADAALKAVFAGKATVNMFEMTKLVSKHLSYFFHPPGNPGMGDAPRARGGLLHFPLERRRDGGYTSTVKSRPFPLLASLLFFLFSPAGIEIAHAASHAVIGDSHLHSHEGKTHRHAHGAGHHRLLPDGASITVLHDAAPGVESAAASVVAEPLPSSSFLARTAPAAPPRVKPAPNGPNPGRAPPA